MRDRLGKCNRGGMASARSVSIITVALICGCLIVLSCAPVAAEKPSPAAIIVDQERREIRVRAVSHPSHLARSFVQPGHHAVVWEKGRAHYGALFASRASDHEVRTALLALGATPGENLTEATWNERKNPGSPAPDQRVEGTPVDVLVEWPGSGGAVPLSQLILERGKPASFDFRFAGNERYQKDFKSGCIVCDYSCPGGSIGNRNRTIRDEEKSGVTFTVNERLVPKEGTEVTVIFRPRPVH